MAQGDREYKINEKANKARYLKYFPVSESGESPLTEEKREAETDRKTCVYCGNIHVRQYTQEAFEICEDCYGQLLGSGQEFTDALWQTRRSLEQLMGISVDQSINVIYRRNWLQRRKRYFGKAKDGGSGFGKDFVRQLRESEKEITFIVYERMPRFIFAYLTAGYMIGALLEKRVRRLSGYMAYRPMKYAMMKWCSLHYMYLNGYIDFCRRKEMAELEDVEYRELTEEIGFPTESRRRNMSEIADILNEKIDRMEEREGQEEQEEGSMAEEEQEEGSEPEKGSRSKEKRHKVRNGADR